MTKTSQDDNNLNYGTFFKYFYDYLTEKLVQILIMPHFKAFDLMNMQ